MGAKSCCKLAGGAIQHRQSDVGNRAEAAALNHHGLVVEHFRGLHDLAIGREHGRVGEPLFHQLQAHQAVVHLGEGRTRKLDHVHFDPAAAQIVHQRGDQVREIVRHSRTRRRSGSRPPGRAPPAVDTVTASSISTCRMISDGSLRGSV